MFVQYFSPSFTYKNFYRAGNPELSRGEFFLKSFQAAKVSRPEDGRGRPFKLAD